MPSSLSSGSQAKVERGGSRRQGFYNAAPIPKNPLPAYTPDAEATAYTGAPAALADAALRTDLNNLRVAYEALRVSHDAMRARLVALGLM